MHSNKRRSTNRITLRDVAREAGVSPITVSRTLRRPEQVSEPVRITVQQAIHKLGYIPNRSASRLASAQSHTVCAIIPSLTNSVFVDVIKAIDDVLFETDYQVLIGNTRYSPMEEEKLVATFLEHNPDGMIVAGVDQTDRCRQLLSDVSIPIVQIMEYDDRAIDMNVGFSHFHAGYSITNHLVERGYQQIGFIGAQMDPRTQKRMQGYVKAIEDAGLPTKNMMVNSWAPSTVKMGGELLLDLLSKAPKLDAVFCCNDDLAMGAIFECQRSNIDVPGQIAIAGYNDLEASRCVNPGLTTVLTPRYEMGHMAATMLVRCMNGEQLPEHEKRVDLGYELVIRASS